jgi:hypothetical protein
VRLDSILVSISIIAPRASAVQGWWPCDDFSNVVFAPRQIAYVGRRGDGGAAPQNMAIYRRGGGNWLYCSRRFSHDTAWVNHARAVGWPRAIGGLARSCLSIHGGSICRRARSSVLSARS